MLELDWGSYRVRIKEGYYNNSMGKESYLVSFRQRLEMSLFPPSKHAGE